MDNIVKKRYQWIDRLKKRFEAYKEGILTTAQQQKVDILEKKFNDYYLEHEFPIRNPSERGNKWFSHPT